MDFTSWDDSLTNITTTHSNNVMGITVVPRSSVTVKSNSTTETDVSIDYVGYVCVPLLLVIGLIGNTLTIIVMKRSKTLYAMSVSRILIALAVSDSVLISLLPFNKKFVVYLLGVDVRTLCGDIGCKIFYWAFRTAKMTSSWLVVLISIERFIAIWFPLQARDINTTKRALVGVALVYLIIGTYNGVWCSFSDHIVNGVCLPNSKHGWRAKITGGFLVTGLTIYCFLPATLLCIINALIIVKIMTAARKSRRMQTGKSKKELTGGKPTLMLIGISAAFVILVTPIASAHLVSYVKNQYIFNSSETWVVFLRELSQLMEQTNYSINFFLYVLLGEMFRRQLFELFGCKKARKPTQTTGVTFSSSSNSHSKRYFSGSSIRSILTFNNKGKDKTVVVHELEVKNQLMPDQKQVVPNGETITEDTVFI